MNNNRHLARLYNYRKEEAKSIARAKQLRENKTNALIESTREYIENNNKELANALKTI